jgi:hypothetical protein
LLVHIHSGYRDGNHLPVLFQVIAIAIDTIDTVFSFFSEFWVFDKSPTQWHHKIPCYAKTFLAECCSQWLRKKTNNRNSSEQECESTVPNLVKDRRQALRGLMVLWKWFHVLYYVVIHLDSGILSKYSTDLIYKYNFW